MNRILMLLMALPILLSADQPPDWKSFVIHSENREWSAHVYPDKLSNEPWKENWTLEVFKGLYLSQPDPSVKPIWTSQYNPSGYSGGYLSNDGSTFAYVEYWYYPYNPVVKIYKEQCRIVKNGTFFNVEGGLTKTASHTLWLKMNGKVEFLSIEGLLYLQLETVKGLRKVVATCGEHR